MEALIHSDGITAKVGLAIGAILLISVANHLFNEFRASRALSKFPIANEKWDAEAKKKFTESAGEILARGVALVSSLILLSGASELILTSRLKEVHFD